MKSDFAYLTFRVFRKRLLRLFYCVEKHAAIGGGNLLRLSQERRRNHSPPAIPVFILP